MGFDIPSGAKYVLQTLATAGYEAYLVGGCVRDLIRGVPPHDWDICTSAHPEQTKACFPGHRIIEAGVKHGTVTVMEDGRPYEITTYRTEGPYTDGRRPDFVRFVPSLEADLARRDFTMNAAAIGLDGRLRDPFGGADDIREGLIRCVGCPDQRFQEDGLRIMRALRFACVIGCRIERATAQAIHHNRAVLNRVAAQRINAELCRLLTGAGVGEILLQYPDVLCTFWPQLCPPAMTGPGNPPDWEHTARAVDAAPADVVPRLAILLHGSGRPGYQPAGERGCAHPAHGAQLADQMLRALKFDNATRKRVATLVEYYDVQLPPEGHAVRRWLSRLGEEAFFQLLEVKAADLAAEKADSRLAQLEEARAIAQQTIALHQCLTLKDLAVDGRDVLAAGAAPGPQVGRVLDTLLERVLSGELPNQRETLLKQLRERV